MRAFSKRAFNYAGQEMEQGQVFEMVGARNDQKLLALDLCRKVDKHTEVLNCTCGLSFVGEGCLRNHQAGKVHPKEPILVTSS